MTVFAHHAEAYFEMEIMGRSFPDGMTEHAIAYTALAMIVGLVSYGAYSAIRDLRRWRTRKVVAA